MDESSQRVRRGNPQNPQCDENDSKGPQHVRVLSAEVLLWWCRRTCAQIVEEFVELPVSFLLHQAVTLLQAADQDLAAAFRGGDLIVREQTPFALDAPISP